MAMAVPPALPYTPGTPAQAVDVRCGAKTRKGTPCPIRPVTGRTRCRMHGGAIPRGMGLPQTTTGRYSKDLPTRLAARYLEARRDPELLALTSEIALLDTRMGEVVDRLNTGESRAAWGVLASLWATFTGEWQDYDGPAMTQAIAQVTAVIEQGMAEAYTWDEIRTLIRERAALVANERQRLVQAQQMITAEEAMVLLASVVDTVRRHVTDRKALTAISNEISALTLRGQSGGR